MAAVNSWHNNIITWKTRNEFLFKNEIMSDCKFIVIEGTRKTKIPAHKYILGGNSEEFYNLFYLMKASDEIPIEDISGENLTKFLEFLYTEKTTLTMTNVGDLLKLARRYSVTHFEKFCAEFLSENVNKETALSVIDKCTDYQMPNLIRKCIKLISHNQLIFESPSFLNVSIQTITELLKSNELRGFKEITIFNGVNKWAENCCQENNQEINLENKRLAVKPALRYIRFAAMSYKEFTLCTLSKPILTSAEIIEIYQFIGTKGKSKCTFSDKNRCENKTFEFILDKLLGQHPFTFEEPHNYNTFSFSVNKSIFFQGFGMLEFDPKALTEQNPEKLIIKLRDDLNTVLLESIVEIHYDGSDKIYDLLFDNSMLLKPDITYRVSINRQISGSFESHFFNKSNIVEEFDGVRFVIKNAYMFKSITFGVEKNF